MASITSANAVLILTVPDAFIFQVQLQNFSADDIFSVDNLQRKEVVMGVDGFLSAGRVNNSVKMGVTLMADSDSLRAFEAWDAAEQALNDVAYGFMQVDLPSVNRSYACVKGALDSINPMPSAGKTLKSRQYSITWESINWSPL